MYKLVTITDLVRIPPEKFGSSETEAALEVLKLDHEGVLNREIGIIIAVIGVESMDEGRLIPGDGAAYHNVTFTALAYRPLLQEVVEGEVVEIVDFGAFIRLGPMDGLCHVSQITDDFISYDNKKSVLLGKESGRVLRENDLIRGRIIAVSIGGRARSGKLGLTMRQPNLGKLDWIKEEVKKSEKAEKAAAKKK